VSMVAKQVGSSVAQPLSEGPREAPRSPEQSDVVAFPMERRVALRYRIEFRVLRAFSWVLTVLPEWAATGLGAGLGWFVGVVLRVRRVDTDRHLRIAFPERGSSWRRRTARGSYVHFAREAAMTMRLARMGPEEMIRRTEVEGLEALREAAQHGRGAVVISGHLGNWEVAAAAMAARGLAMDVAAHRQKNPLVYRHMAELRNRLGLTVITKNEAFRRVPRALAAGRVVALIADQNIQKRGVFVDFFGRAAATAKGPALFAHRSGAPVFLGVAVRKPGYPSQYRVIIEPVPVPEGATGSDVVRSLTQHHVSRLEALICEAPDQYFWQHRRWKTRPEAPRERSPESGLEPR
jgi:KDO2-lipid IV(A) lauroyltransferase